MLDKFFSSIERFVPVKWRWVLGHGGFRRYFANTGWLFFSRVFILFLAFFVSIYVARYLGPEKYGLMNYIISFVGLFSFIPSLGLNSILSRELVKDPSRKDVLLGTAFFLQVFGGVLGIVCVNFVSWFILGGEKLVNYLILFVSLTFLLQALNVVDVYFQSRVMAKKVALIQVTYFFISSLIKVLFIILKFDYSYFVMLSLLEAFILACGLFFTYKKNNFSFSSWKFDFSLAKGLLKNSWPLMFSSAFLFIYSRIDQIMIKQMMNDYYIGLYSVTAKLSEVWIFIPSAIVGSLFPAIVNSKKTNQEVYKSRFKRLYSLLFFLSLLMSLLIFIFSKFLIQFLFGVEYMGALSSLRIYVWSGIATSIGFAISQYLIVENRTKELFFLNFFSMLINICLNLVLIPRYGIEGAAFATLFSYFTIIFGLSFNKESRRHLVLIFKSIFYI